MPQDAFDKHIIDITGVLQQLQLYSFGSPVPATRLINDLLSPWTMTLPEFFAWAGEFTISYTSSLFDPSDVQGYIKELKSQPREVYGRSFEDAMYGMLGSYDSSKQAGYGVNSSEALFQAFGIKTYEHKCLYDKRYRNGAGQGQFTVEQEAEIERCRAEHGFDRDRAKALVRAKQMATSGGVTVFVGWPKWTPGATRWCKSAPVVGVDVMKPRLS